MNVDISIRNVRAVLSSGVMHADIEISDGRISAISPAGQRRPARRVIEGAGREAFPGLIDPHVHFRFDPATGPGDSFDDVAEAAARGGFTSMIAFVTAPPESVGMEAINPVLEQISSAPVDFGLHHVLWPRRPNVDAIPEVINAGIGAVKMFLAYPERGLMFDGGLALDALSLVAEAGGIMSVHCEEGHAISWLESRGKRALGAAARIDDYYATRPYDLESVSVNLVGLWAKVTGCPLHLVHISTRAGADAGVRLRARGQDVSIETCPQYLELDTADLLRLGSLAKFAPVLRTQDDRQGLWQAVRRRDVSIIGSDHSGHSKRTKLRIGDEAGIFEVPFGMPGLETLFPVLYTAGVCTGLITHEELADLVSTNAAKRFGWYPDKGTIRVGSHADLTLVDPTQTAVVDAEALRSNAGYSPFEGRQLRGWPSMTILRGEVVLENGELQSANGHFVKTVKDRNYWSV